MRWGQETIVSPPNYYHSSGFSSNSCLTGCSLQRGMFQKISTEMCLFNTNWIHYTNNNYSTVLADLCSPWGLLWYMPFVQLEHRNPQKIWPINCQRIAKTRKRCLEKCNLIYLLGFEKGFKIMLVKRIICNTIHCNWLVDGNILTFLLIFQIKYLYQFVVL